ncbi:LysR family transcriptional regulator [Sphingomonas oleivorans]|nr:LysR family transcriptional regulator [Sphingomonas oleivorans]
MMAQPPAPAYAPEGVKERAVLDWDDLKTFLAIARQGSLSAAARSLKVSQTTMGRRLDHLHGRAGAKLLERTPTGFRLTPAGERILDHVARMEQEALALERAIAGEDMRLEGLVRVTTVETFGAHVLTPALAALRARHPGIAVEFITDTRPLSLARREADIAIRLAAFEGHETIVRKIGAMAFGVYAAPAYLAAHGEPDWGQGAIGHALIRLQDDLSTTPEARWFSALAHDGTPSLLANSREVQLRGAVAGLGLGCLPRYLADGMRELVHLATPGPEPVREIWMGVHRDTRATPRIRAVQDAIIRAVEQARPRLLPDNSALDEAKRG